MYIYLLIYACPGKLLRQHLASIRKRKKKGKARWEKQQENEIETGNRQGDRQQGRQKQHRLQLMLWLLFFRLPFNEPPLVSFVCMFCTLELLLIQHSFTWQRIHSQPTGSHVSDFDFDINWDWDSDCGCGCGTTRVDIQIFSVDRFHNFPLSYLFSLLSGLLSVACCWLLAMAQNTRVSFYLLFIHSTAVSLLMSLQSSSICCCWLAKSAHWAHFGFFFFW